MLGKHKVEISKLYIVEKGNFLFRLSTKSQKTRQLLSKPIAENNNLYIYVTTVRDPLCINFNIKLNKNKI